MKAVWIGVVLFVVVTLAATVIGASHSKPGDIIAPVVGSMVTSAILIGLMTWENKKELS
ncbi:hypothetical protein [Salibacterium lacus]|uniref:Uncharacterized protein n=1 Tax=Salibacterium lacus TaxID=1898109 RepID=A0ABW5T4T9_9BACI